MAGAERKPKEVVVSDLAQISVPKELGVRGSGEIFTLEQAIRKYKTDPTPESATQFNDFFWAEACRVEGKGRKIIVPKLSEAIDVKKERLYYDGIQCFDPPEVSLIDLVNMFPNMGRRWVQKGRKIIDRIDNSGYFSANMNVKAPYLETTEGEWMKKLEQEGLQPMSLKHYIIYGQMMYLLIGKYPDQGFNRGSTWSRVGSDYEGRIISVHFWPDGDLDIDSDLTPENNEDYLGGRGERKIEAA